MSKLWTQQEDKLLKQLVDIGLTAKLIHENYGEVLQSRTQNAIATRISYLNKPYEERMKEDKESIEGIDILVQTFIKQTDRICNRLDTISSDLIKVKRLLEENTVHLDENQMKVLHEIKAIETLNQTTTETIKRELRNTIYRKERKK